MRNTGTGFIVLSHHSLFVSEYYCMLILSSQTISVRINTLKLAIVFTAIAGNSAQEKINYFTLECAILVHLCAAINYSAKCNSGNRAFICRNDLH